MTPANDNASAADVQAHWRAEMQAERAAYNAAVEAGGCEGMAHHHERLIELNMRPPVTWGALRTRRYRDHTIKGQ